MQSLLKPVLVTLWIRAIRTSMDFTTRFIKHRHSLLPDLRTTSTLQRLKQRLHIHPYPSAGHLLISSLWGLPCSMNAPFINLFNLFCKFIEPFVDFGRILFNKRLELSFGHSSIVAGGNFIRSFIGRFCTAYQIEPDVRAGRCYIELHHYRTAIIGA